MEYKVLDIYPGGFHNYSFDTEFYGFDKMCTCKGYTSYIILEKCIFIRL